MALRWQIGVLRIEFPSTRMWITQWGNGIWIPRAPNACSRARIKSYETAQQSDPLAYMLGPANRRSSHQALEPSPAATGLRESPAARVINPCAMGTASSLEAPNPIPTLGQANMWSIRCS